MTDKGCGKQGTQKEVRLAPAAIAQRKALAAEIQSVQAGRVDSDSLAQGAPEKTLGSKEAGLVARRAARL